MPPTCPCPSSSWAWATQTSRTCRYWMGMTGSCVHQRASPSSATSSSSSPSRTSNTWVAVGRKGKGRGTEVLNFWKNHRALINTFQAENVTHSPGKSGNIKTYINEALCKNTAEQSFALDAVFQLFLYLLFLLLHSQHNYIIEDTKLFTVKL